MAEAETTEQERVKGGGIQLFVENPERTDPNVAIRWCVSPGVWERLRVKGAGMAWLFISVRHEKAGEVLRKLVPLDQMMEYLQFYRPGRHTIYATVVYASAGMASGFKLRNALLGRQGPRRYQLLLFEKSSEGAPRFRPGWIRPRNGAPEGVSTVGLGELDVMAPDGLFAKEPPEWLARWVYGVWDKPQEGDECAFRKHLIFAFTLQPVLLAVVCVLIAVAAIVWITLKFLWALAGTLMGVRPYTPAEKEANYGVNWRAVFGRPFVYMGDVWDGDFFPAGVGGGGSFLLYNRKGEPREPDWFWKFFTPMIWVGVFAVLTLDIGRLLMKKSMAAALLFGAKWMLIGFASCVGVLLFVMAGIWLSSFARPFLPDWGFRRDERKERREKERRARQAAREEAWRRAFESRVAAIICDARPKVPRLEELPPERQTIHLRFKRLKARACRPYAIRS